LLLHGLLLLVVMEHMLRRHLRLRLLLHLRLRRLLVGIGAQHLLLLLRWRLRL
jgi:hypothetical protein